MISASNSYVIWGNDASIKQLLPKKYRKLIFFFKAIEILSMNDPFVEPGNCGSLNVTCVVTWT